jgi:spore photoproduct lyase
MSPLRLLPAFHTVYVEQSLLAHPPTRAVLARLPRARVVEVESYRDVFLRPRQDVALEKAAPALMLARREEFLYPLSPLCEAYGAKQPHYASALWGCPYDCGFCFLKGMFGSGHVVAFMNLEDCFTEAETKGPDAISASFEGDALALSALLPHAAAWVRFAAEHPGVSVELRTRSARVGPLLERPPLPNLIPAFSLLPESLSSWERGAPSLAARLRAARALQRHGYRVRLCLEPLLGSLGDELALVEAIRQNLDPAHILDVNLAPFRMAREQFRRLEPLLPEVLPVAESAGVVRLPFEHLAALREALSRFLPEAIIYIEEERI